MAAKKTVKEEQEAEVLHPHRPVVLSNGKTVLVTEWGLKLGGEQTVRVVALVDRIRKEAQAGPQDADAMLALVTHAQDDILEIVRVTVGWSPGEAEENVKTFEDLLDLWEAVWETSLVKPTGGGTLAKVLRLVGQTTSALNAAAGSIG